MRQLELKEREQPIAMEKTAETTNKNFGPSGWFNLLRRQGGPRQARDHQLVCLTREVRLCVFETLRRQPCVDWLCKSLVPRRLLLPSFNVL